jgi:hypothetical protein
VTVVSALSPDELKDAISWLQMFKEPYSRVEELWKRTQYARLSFIHSDNNPPSLNKVLENWPRYSDTKGHLLIGMDFQKLRPSKSDCMASKGPTVMERTLSLMKQQKQMVGYLKKKMVDWLKQLPKAPEDNDEDGNSATSSMHCALVIW